MYDFSAAEAEVTSAPVAHPHAGKRERQHRRHDHGWATRLGQLVRTRVRGGSAVDLLDRACRTHDKCYASKGYFNCSCDRSLIAAIKRDYNRMHTTEKIASTAVKAYFSAQIKVKC